MALSLVWSDKMRNTGPNCWIIQRREESGTKLLDLGYFNHFLQVGRFQKDQFLKDSGRVHLKKFHCLCREFTYLSPDLMLHWQIPETQTFLRHSFVITLLSLVKQNFSVACSHRTSLRCFQENCLVQIREEKWGGEWRGRRWEGGCVSGGLAACSFILPGFSAACSLSSTCDSVKDTNPNYWGVPKKCPSKAGKEFIIASAQADHQVKHISL